MNLKVDRTKHPVIFDVLYGFIPITEWEEKIINSPHFQRLRWIKQLGFANYIFPGAEHNRFSHVIGVMHSMDQMLRALGIAVPQHQLMDKNAKDEQTMLHKCCRIAALLHDIGTFPFSHAIEFAYIRHGNDDRGKEGKRQRDLPNDHEHLGSFIIKNTRMEGGITQILEEYGLDVNLISHIIKGDSPYFIANQLMHSDLDADRMDYLMRDSHYTGIKYGQFDREYIMANLTTYVVPSGKYKGQIGFGVRENALRAVEDFLIARFNWYSQVVKNPGSAKFDILSTKVAEEFLNLGWIHQFHDILDMVEKGDERFFWWNDVYFMTRLQDARLEKKFKGTLLGDLVAMLLYRRAPKTMPHPDFTHRIIPDVGADESRESRIRKLHSRLKEMQKIVSRKGSGKDWILADIPQKDVAFTTGTEGLKKLRVSNPEKLSRDPVRIVSKDGSARMLVEIENSLMRTLSGYTNFVPSVYASEGAYKILREAYLQKDEKESNSKKG